ncbi:MULTISPECIES: helix-turn-helix domain-containing protein [Marinobacter]|uniref:Transcriptional regulator n=1 Tax=Marinobacter profundi TaxID=2666256 RepID=A0A2G1URQ8_9GAMM|nr:MULTISPECIES: AraC family transcriptional regulator [Marinobacter]MBD3656675.1 helix-turn-helix transcriptional regulator [Marinobacter sp.]PHQ17100.1 transcriptional regulator [Marinobacter profundi]
MANSLLTPNDILSVIPGQITCEGTVENKLKQQLSIRNYRFDRTEVLIPEMRDYMLVRWESPPAKLGFRGSNGWLEQQACPDNVTILARGEPSRWYWSDDIQVSHVYVSESAITKIANEVFEKDIDSLNIDHSAVAHDAILAELMKSYERECLAGRLGGELYTGALEMQICIHLIRDYSNCKLREIPAERRMPILMRKKLEEFIVANLDQCISIDDLAEVAGFSNSYFIRMFRNDFGAPPHAYILERRLEMARSMLESSPDTPIKVVAMECGFSDQSHLTRLFKSKFHTTPYQYRKNRRITVHF